MRKMVLAGLLFGLSLQVEAHTNDNSVWVELEFDKDSNPSAKDIFLQAGASIDGKKLKTDEILFIEKILCGSRLESSPPTHCTIYQNSKKIHLEGDAARPLINLLYKETFKIFDKSMTYHLRFGYLKAREINCSWDENSDGSCFMLLHRPRTL